MRDVQVDQDLVDELVMFITNDGDIYRQTIIPTINNLKRKIKRGIFDPELAIQAFTYAAKAGFKKYQKDDPRVSIGHGAAGHTMKAVAAELYDTYEEHIHEDSVEQPQPGTTDWS